MRQEIDIVFALLRSALDGTVPEIEPLDASRWWNLFRLLQKNHVAALVTDGVSRLPQALQPPRDVFIPWLAEQEKASAWYRHQQQVQQKIVDLLQQNGINTLVLKGTHTAQYYPNPELREFGDLDLYFYDKHDEADRLIQRRFSIDITNDINHHTKYNLSGVTVESHYHLLNHYHPHSNRSYEALLKELISENYQPSTLLPASQALSTSDSKKNPAKNSKLSTFEILFLLRHMACHFAASRITLRDLVDWALTCCALHDKVDWEKVNTVVKDFGMEPFFSALNTIVAQRLGQQTLNDSQTHGLTDTKTQHLLERDIIYGNPQSAEREREDLGRLVWKLRRWRANRWKQRLVFNDSPFSLWFSNLGAHTHNPRSILHKM
ncbi:MAG: nucleotidyltransferase family protein [Bacteroidales bacterium]|nr:nucleotidyltransferase family protein [Bacteroidales bacterium]